MVVAVVATAATATAVLSSEKWARESVTEEWNVGGREALVWVSKVWTAVEVR